MLPEYTEPAAKAPEDQKEDTPIAPPEGVNQGLSAAACAGPEEQSKSRDRCHEDDSSYRELRHEITRSGKPEIIAFVEGGFTGIPATARGNEPALVNDIGERYFMQMKGLLCLGLESAIEMYVLDPLSHQNGGDDDLTRHIKHNVTKNNKAPEYKKALEQN